MGLIQQAKQGVIWTFLQQFSVQLINFVVQIVMARILLPSDYGLIAMLTIFIAVSQTLVDSGMTTSLIRTKNIGEKDYATVFVTNIGISVLLYFISYIIAPLIATFYNQDILESILRVYALTFVLNAFVAVHLAKLTKELNFKKQFLYQVPSTLIGALGGLVMAYLGFGVWSLVFLNLLQVFFYAFSLWVFSDWRPKIKFYKEKFNYHFSFGYKLTLSGLLNTIYLNLYRILIGKFYTPAQVGYFTQADNMRNLPARQLSNVLNKVTYPLFSGIKEDYRLKAAYKSTMMLVLSVTAGIMLCLLLIAKPLFLILLGEKWLPAVKYFQILCLASILLPIGTYNLNILKVKGRSDLFLKVEIIKKVIGVACLLLALNFGIKAIVWSLCLTNIFFAYFNGFFSGRLINYELPEQFSDTVVILLLAGVPAGILYYLESIISITNNYIHILVLVLSYFVMYTSLIVIFNKNLLIQIRKIIKK